MRIFGLFLIVVLLISACGAPAAPSQAPAQAPAAPAATSAPAAPAKTKPLIAGVVFQADTFMQTIQAGIQAGADAAGADVILGNTEMKLDKETSMIDDYITRGVDVIVITPISADGSTAALKKAKDAGVKVICFNTCVNEPGIATAFIGTNNTDLGTKTGIDTAKFIQDVMGGSAKIGILNCDQFEVCKQRKAGFMAELEGLTGIEIVADQAGWEPDKAQPVAEAMLQAHPEINLFWAANEIGTIGAATAVKTLGLQGEVYVFGTDMTTQMGQMLQSDDNILQSVTGQAPYMMGYDALMMAIDDFNSKPVKDADAPTIFFRRGDDEMIEKFAATDGKMIFPR